ncbi:unnamed protein product, partial [Laminaria digitata]
SYGFVLPGNPYGCLDYWIRVPPTDPGFGWKQALLDGHDLTATQAYDFSGTLRAGGWVSPALLATARVAQLNASEGPAAENAFQGEVVSPRNEAAAMGALIAGLRRKLAGQSSSDPDDFAALEEQLRQRQKQQEQQQEQQEQQQKMREEEQQQQQQARGGLNTSIEGGVSHVVEGRGGGID